MREFLSIDVHSDTTRFTSILGLEAYPSCRSHALSEEDLCRPSKDKFFIVPELSQLDFWHPCQKQFGIATRIIGSGQMILFIRQLRGSFEQRT